MTPAINLLRKAGIAHQVLSFRILLLQCWMGMSRYLTIFGSLAITSISSSSISSG